MVIGPATQQAILEEIPAPARGAFLAMARLGIRPSEAVVLARGDLRGGWLHVARARKDRTLQAPVWGTKTGAPRLLPVPEDLAAWIESYSPREPGSLLFPNPLTGGPWSEAALRRTWIRARKEIGVEVGLWLLRPRHPFAASRLGSQVYNSQSKSVSSRSVTITEYSLVLISKSSLRRASGELAAYQSFFATLSTFFCTWLSCFAASFAASSCASTEIPLSSACTASPGSNFGTRMFSSGCVERWLSTA
jgi:hypothetical protein